MGGTRYAARKALGMACGQKSVKNLKENLTKIINKQVLLSKSLICIKIRQIRSIRVQEENIISVRFERSV